MHCNLRVGLPGGDITRMGPLFSEQFLYHTLPYRCCNLPCLGMVAEPELEGEPGQDQRSRKEAGGGNQEPREKFTGTCPSSYHISLLVLCPETRRKTHSMPYVRGGRTPPLRSCHGVLAVAEVGRRENFATTCTVAVW